MKQYLSNSSFVFGLIFMAVSATAFGSAPTFAKLAFDNFITPSSLQSYRFLITFVVVLIVTIAAKQVTKPTPAHLPRLLILAISTGLSSLCYMTSVKYVTVAVASLTFLTCVRNICCQTDLFQLGDPITMCKKVYRRPFTNPF